MTTIGSKEHFDFVYREIVRHQNKILANVAQVIENMSLYEGFDERTRDYAATIVRSHMIPEVRGEEVPSEEQ